ncbi:MAG: hypothetical protein BGP02_06565 [Pandoraea sp. 64-18]|nr:MAG: hypothetical protein BGP02_06565 [Pandoraea sp. 64-18]
MTRFMNDQDIASVFAALDLPLADKSIQDIEAAKDRFFNTGDSENGKKVVHRIVISNGTGVLKKEKNAELEPSFI